MFVDQAFSYKLESAEFLPSIEWIDALIRDHPERGPTHKMVGGGWMLYAGPDSPANHIIGLGLKGPVSKAEVDTVEEFYHSRRSLCEVVVSPYADMSLLTELGARGYRITEWNSVLVREVKPGDHFQTGDFEVRPVRPDEVLRWADVLARGFEEFQAVAPDVFLPLATAPSAMAFLARMDGRIVGGACGSLFPGEGIASLYGAATLPEFRNRGVQNALFQARLRRAAEAGCRWAVACTQPGTVSQRNAERNGLRVAYTKVAMQRHW
jgi:ribosomal protein S18 acetylase RimI-like enzyme